MSPVYPPTPQAPAKHQAKPRDPPASSSQRSTSMIN
jgi:hypothetical protein